MDEKVKALAFYRRMKQALKACPNAHIKLTLLEDGEIEADLIFEKRGDERKRDS